MSIIHDALRKAQREPAKVTPAVVNEIHLKTNFREELLGKKPPINWGPLFVLGVLILIVGPILAPLFSAPIRTANISSQNSHSSKATGSEAPELVSVGSVMPQTLPPASLRSPAMSPQFAIEEMPAPPTFMAPSSHRANLDLSGIVFSEKESYCLVNGKVLKVGDSVSGAAVVNITQDQVTFDVGGELVSVSTSV